MAPATAGTLTSVPQPNPFPPLDAALVSPSRVIFFLRPGCALRRALLGSSPSSASREGIPEGSGDTPCSLCHAPANDAHGREYLVVRVHPALSHRFLDLIVSDLLTRTVSMIMLILEEDRRVFADLRREVHQMDMTAVTFVALLMLMLVFFT